MEITDLFSQYQHYAFRLEALPQYSVEDETDAIDYFSRHGALPAGHNADWAELIRGNVRGGKAMERLRLFTLPLNSYEQFERAAYEINMAAGEAIRVADRADFDDVQDFWAFDDEWIARMIYDDAGGWHGAEVARMSEGDLKLVRYWREVFRASADMRDAYPLK
jgi:hypothetical protein